MAEEMQNKDELDLTQSAPDEEQAEANADAQSVEDVAETTGNAGEVGVRENAHWYVVHTYSGYEKKVMDSLLKTIENRGLENQIFEVRVPVEDVVELKNGVNRKVQRKMFPGYVLVNMEMNDETWYVVRNTRGVTGFVGPGSKPVPLSDAEIKPLGIKTESVTVDFAVGDEISVVAGVWNGTVGIVQRMDFGKQTATINVNLFGRETPVEIGFTEVRRVNS